PPNLVALFLARPRCPPIKGTCRGVEAVSRILTTRPSRSVRLSGFPLAGSPRRVLLEPVGSPVGLCCCAPLRPYQGAVSDLFRSFRRHQAPSYRHHLPGLSGNFA